MRTVVSPPLQDVDQPRANDVYEFTQDVQTINGKTHKAGTRLRLIRKTDEAPHGYSNPQGNWWCDVAGDGKSVWSSIHDCIASGLIRRVSSPGEDPLPSRFERKEPL